MWQKITDEISTIASDRLKNPYISTFIISWLIFNWRPFIYFIFSKEMVEKKLNYISLHYTNIWFTFILPLVCTLFYIFLLPRINKVTERFNYYNDKTRADHLTQINVDKIERETRIATKEIIKEYEIAKARDAESENKTIDELNFTINELQQKLNDERSEKNDIILKYENIIKESKQANEQHNNSILSEYKDMKLQHDQFRVIAINNENKLNKNLIEAEDKSNLYEFLLERQKSPYDKLIKLNNNRTLFEEFSSTGHVSYYDLDKRKLITAKDFYILLRDNPYIEIRKGENAEFNSAEEILKSILPF